MAENKGSSEGEKGASSSITKADDGNMGEIKDAACATIENVIKSGKVFVSGQDMNLSLTDQELELKAVTGPDSKAKKSSKNDLSLTWRDVIKVETASDEKKNEFTIHFIKKQKNKSLKTATVKVICPNEKAEGWSRAITEQCQKVPGRPKKLFVVINPIGGNGKGVSMYEKQVAPNFALANIETTVVKTEREKHAKEIGENTDFSSYDGIISVGGDGLYQEVLQGYFSQIQKAAGIDINDKNAKFVAPKIPFCLIPAGSSNGIVRMTNDDVEDATTSALRVVRGEVHALNILTIHEPGKFVGLCALAFSIGMVTDILKKSDEDLRWMGKARYFFAFASGMLKKRRYFDAEMEYKVLEGAGGEGNAEWKKIEIEGKSYTAVTFLIGRIKNVGNKSVVDLFSKSGFLAVDTGCSNFNLIKFAGAFSGKQVQGPIPNLTLIDEVLGYRAKIARPVEETEENASSSRRRARELEHFVYCDGEVLRLDGLEMDVRLQQGFVSLFSCLPTGVKPEEKDMCVVMFGALHTEKMLYEGLGDWLEGSGWTSLLSVCGVASSGVADSLIKVTHLTRTCYMHQVTALALYSLLRQAHREYLKTTIEDEPLELDAWTECQRDREPHFLYWH